MVTRMLGRSIALAVALFCLANLVLRTLDPAWDANIWWIDLRSAPDWLTQPLLLLAAGLLGAYAVVPATGRWRRRATIMAAATLAAVCLANAATCAWLDATGRIATPMPLPFSLAVAVALGVVGWAAANPGAPRRAEWVLVFGGGALVAGVAVLLLMVQFGRTDYRRPADAIVVFGARTYADGRVSDALADRLRTAAELYHAGLAPTLVMSGGPGDGDIHETQAMRRFAIDLDVPSDTILLDASGESTSATIRNTRALFDAHGIGSALAVSHAYHLPRVKMAYERAGLTVYTVPARESFTLTKMPLFMLREVAAFWWYYARPTG